MERSGELTVRIGGGDADADAGQLAEFITLFRAAYNAGLSLDLAADQAPPAAASRLRRDLAGRNVGETNKLFGDRQRDALRTKRVSHDSPLDVVLWGVLVPMAAAVILAGGKVELGKFKAALSRGLGESIAALRNAFVPRVKASLGYGVQAITIKLSTSEFDGLMKQDPRTKKRGGWQGKIIQLQSRMDRAKRTLTLYQEDVDWILRHGSNPKKGGFQQRIRKIFGRHFWPDAV